MLGFVLGFIL